MNIPLIIDLDHSLIKTDTSWEALRKVLMAQPKSMLGLFLQATHGRGTLKNWLQQKTRHEVRDLPYREEVLKIVRVAQKKKRKVLIYSGAPHNLVLQVAAHLNLDEGGHRGSTPQKNLTKYKAEILTESWGLRGFDYIGDSSNDLETFRACRMGWIVGARPALVRKALRANPLLKILAPRPPLIRSWWDAARPHQWIKNILIFVPLLAGHQLMNAEKVLESLIAFVAFCFFSTSVYLSNDILDLDSDRKHRKKNARPLASGEMTIPEALQTGAICLLLGLGLAVFLGREFLAWGVAYLALTQIYNIFAKKKPGFDIVMLAAFYTLRIMAGGAAANIVCSTWLLGFGIFIFFSLGCAKRVSELIGVRHEMRATALGRGYFVGDLGTLSQLGISSGVLAVLVAALFVNSSEVANLYKKPQLLLLVCPLLLIWVSKIWIVTARGELSEDPVLYAMRDKASWILLVAILAIVGFASN